MLEKLIQGGPLMLPLLVCSVLAVAVIIDRLLAFKANSEIDTRALRAKVLTLLVRNKPAEAATLCTHTTGPVAAVLLAGLDSYARHKAFTTRAESVTLIMKEAMTDYAQHAMSGVEKRLNVLSTVGNAAPLFGMTGTVTGMISSFNAIAGAGGISAGLVAGGISEALITTAAGLLIALLAVIPYHWFTARADDIHLEIQETISELLDFVATQLERPTTGPSPLPSE